MGFQTSLVVLNDSLHNIKDDGNFGRKIYNAALGISHSRRPIDISSGSHANAASVIECHHADQAVMLVSTGNTMHNLGYVGSWQGGVESYVREMADQLGYRLVKKPQKRRK